MVKPGELNTRETLLIEKTRAGDMNAFDDLFHAYAYKLYSFAFGLLKDHQYAEDLIQDVFIRVWEKREQINPDKQFENYLFTICYNTILKHFRRKKVEQKVLGELIRSFPGDCSDSLSIFHCRELSDAIGMVVDSMPRKRQKVFRMSREDGLAIQEIALELNLSTRTVETHISHALRQIRITLGNVFPELRV